jgi:SAM-dependent methyltransferase
MSEVFRREYAAAYDVIYGEKDYCGECDAIVRLVEKFGDKRVERVIDLGCGTGRHASLLHQRGFNVTGVDRSESMLSFAWQRIGSDQSHKRIRFVQGDIRDLKFSNPFDLALMNFNVLGYMNSNDDLLAALASARRNLREGGLFIADFWYGPAVLADLPGDRVRELALPDGRLFRMASGEHVPERQCCDIRITLLQLQGDRVASETKETHRVRYFFPLELDLALRATNFQFVGVSAFPETGSPPRTDRWLAAVVAVAVES